MHASAGGRLFLPVLFAYNTIKVTSQCLRQIAVHKRGKGQAHVVMYNTLTFEQFNILYMEIFETRK